jgi:hypothetical protein
MHAKRTAEREEKRRISDDFEALKNPSGRQYSEDQRRLLLTQIHGAMERRGMEEFHAINLVADITGAHVNTLRAIYDEWKAEKSVPLPSSEFRGKGNPLHPLYSSPLSIEMECGIHRIIEELNREKGFCDTSDIQDFLKSEFSIEMTRNGLSRRLHALGYRWGRSRSIGGMTIAARRARTVIYVKELSLAIFEENSGSAVICFTDESYVNVRHKPQFTWFSDATPTGNEVGGPSGRGQREIILHAISKGGLLGGDYPVGFDASNLANSFPSAQHFFVGGSIQEDYHTNMDGPLFIHWLRNRFIPAFDVLFPGKKCILVLDNATYHSAKGEEFIPLGGTKSELIASLTKLKVPSITVNRQGWTKSFPLSSWRGKSSPSSPSAKELLDALRVAVVGHPESQRSELQNLFDQRGWQIIWTPQYTPETQPIEKVWAYTKNHIASLFTPRRTPSVLLVQTILSFYGNPSVDHEGVTAVLCQKLILHTYKWCNEFINTHMFSGGNLSSLAAHLRDNPGEEAVPVEIDDQISAARVEEEKEINDVYDFDYVSDDD